MKRFPERLIGVQVTFSKSFLSLDKGIVQLNPALHVLRLSSPGSELGSKLEPRDSGVSVQVLVGLLIICFSPRVVATFIFSKTDMKGRSLCG